MKSGKSVPKAHKMVTGSKFFECRQAVAASSLMATFRASASSATFRQVRGCFDAVGLVLDKNILIPSFDQVCTRYG